MHNLMDRGRFPFPLDIVIELSQLVPKLGRQLSGLMCVVRKISFVATLVSKNRATVNAHLIW